MIQITYNEMGDMMFLRAEGHAEFAPKGQDIVCAAVSALMQTLAYSLDSGTVTCADDRNLMVVQAKQGTDSLAKFELVTDGLILLADATRSMCGTSTCTQTRQMPLICRCLQTVVLRAGTEPLSPLARTALPTGEPTHLQGQQRGRQCH